MILQTLFANSNNKPIPVKQLKSTVSLVEDIVELLDEKAILSLSQGDEGDLDNVVKHLFTECFDIVSSQNKILDPTSFSYVSDLTESIEETLRCKLFNYFISSVLPDFILGWHNLEWGNLVQIYNLLCILAARDHGKSYEFSFAFPLWQMYRYRKLGTGGAMLSGASGVKRELNMSREGMLITNEYGLARHLMDIIKTEIESNEILRERLTPTDRSNNWGADHIECKNGSELVIKSANSKIRGYHPTWMVLDDFLNDSSIYSQDQRDKYWNIFSGVILPALSPSGQLIVVGTPFFETDLYFKLKETKIFKVFEYPAIFPDGRLLFPERHSYESLMEKRELLGSLIFSREILVKPITDDATIFPFSILKNSIKRGEERDLVSNIDNIRREDFVKIAVGCDFAISSTVGSDYSCFTVGGLSKFGKIVVFNCWRKKGANYSEQISVLKKMNRDFLPDIMYVENNNFQEIFVQMMEDADLPVVGKTTGNNKKSLYLGVPRMAAFFETGKVLFPYSSEKSKSLTDLFHSELNSISFISDTGKLESLTQHDDTSMSLWNLCRALLGDKMEFKYSYI